MASLRERRQFERAFEKNPYVSEYMLGLAPMPDVLPAYIRPGDPTEAIVCTSEQLEAWRDSPGALGWMATEFGERRADARG
jgi:hypothetical protein